MRKIASRIPQGLAWGATEIATEIPEETIPQIVGNIQSGQPAMRNVRRTAAETAIATGPFAIAAGVGGGAAKNPDALQDETYGPFRYRPAPNTFPPAPLSFVPRSATRATRPGLPDDWRRASVYIYDYSRTAGAATAIRFTPCSELSWPSHPPLPRNARKVRALMREN
jgi:hypothetical protein